jgi:fucose permease
MASEPGRRGVTLANLVNGAFSLGAVAGPALVSLTRGVGYPLLFACLAVAIVATLPDRRLGVVARPPEPSETGRVNAALLLFCGLLFCYAGLETGLSSWETVHLEAGGYQPGAAAALTSLFWLGMAVSRLSMPALTALLTRSAPVIIVGALSAAFAALALVALPAAAPAGYLLAGLLAGPVFPTAIAWHAAGHPDPRRGNAAVIAAAMVGNVMLPAAIGFAMQATSDLLLPALVAVPVSACLVIALVLRGSIKDPQGRVSSGSG